MRSRRVAREAAVQALYSADSLNDWGPENLSLFFSNFFSEGSELKEKPDSDTVSFARSLVDGVISKLAAIDQIIQSSTRNWSLKRMACVDRNILRLATYEMHFLGDIPLKVSLNEAIEIAKRYGADESPTFVNGVLDKIASLVDGSKKAA